MPIKVGIIGCGSITILRHAPEYRNNPDSEIAGFFDPIRERAEILAKEYNARIYDSIEEMLEDSGIDAISVNSTNATHSTISIAVMKSGKHVLVEKPMATSLAEARDMVETSNKTDRVLMVAQNQRFVPAHMKARELVESGTLGQISSFRTCFKHGGPEFWAVDKNSSTWYFDKNKVTYGVMGDLGIHKLDLIRYILGSEIESLHSTGATLEKQDPAGKLIGVYDTAYAIMKFKNNIMGSMEISWCNHGIMEDNVVIYGKKGVLRLQSDPDYPLVVEMENGERINWILPEQKNGTGVIDAFVSSLVQHGKSPVGGQDAMNSMVAIEACMESSRTGGWVQLKY